MSTPLVVANERPITGATPATIRRPPDIAEVKRAYPLLDVVERAGVALRRSGSSRFQGLCPFHADRNPSFFVDVNRQRFVCYGCHVWGDVLDFVQLHEHLATVAKACAWLTGTPQPPPRKSVLASSTNPERRWDLLTLQEQLVMNAAGTLYRDALWRNATALEYVRGRGVPDWVVRSCGLGYAEGPVSGGVSTQTRRLRVAEDLGLLRRPEPGEDGRPLRGACIAQAGCLPDRRPDTMGDAGPFFIVRTLTVLARLLLRAVPGQPRRVAPGVPRGARAPGRATE